jgi:hypothetical protein
MENSKKRKFDYIQIGDNILVPSQNGGGREIYLPSSGTLLTTNSITGNPVVTNSITSTDHLNVTAPVNKDIFLNTSGTGKTVMSNVQFTTLNTNTILSSLDLAITAPINKNITLNTSGTGVTSATKLESASLTSPTGSGLTINSATNQDITIDALGTGKIKINTVNSEGLIIGVNSTPLNYTNQVCFTPDGILTRPSLMVGVITRAVGETSTNYSPFIGGQISGTSWFPLRVGQEGKCTIIGANLVNPDSSYNASSYNVVCNGQTNIQSGPFYMNQVQFLDSSRNITNCGTINGITIPGGGSGTFARLSDIVTGQKTGCFRYRKQGTGAPDYHGLNVTSYVNSSPGVFTVDFSLSSTLDDAYAVGGIDHTGEWGFVTCDIIVQGPSTTVLVETRNASGTLSDLGFHIIFHAN